MISVNRLQIIAGVQQSGLPPLAKAALSMLLSQLPQDAFDNTLPYLVDLLRALLEGRGEDAVRLVAERTTAEDRAKILAILDNVAAHRVT